MCVNCNNEISEITVMLLYPLVTEEKQTILLWTNKQTQSPVDCEHRFYFMPGKAHSYTESNSFDRLYNVICIYIQAVHIV